MAVTEKEEVPGYWRTAAFVAFVVSVAVGFFLIGNRVVTNTTAIEKGCILLNNKIVESQQEQANPNSRTSVLVGTIIRLMTPEEFRRFQQAPSMTLTNINCEHLADHPNEIRAIPTDTTPARRKDGNSRSSP